MLEGTKRKLKVWAVDAAMVFLALQVAIVMNDSRRVREPAEAATVYEHGGTGQEAENVAGVDALEDGNTSGTGLSLDAGDSEILLKIAMAEAEGEGTDGKALVMCVVLNRVADEGFPDGVREVVFEDGQFLPVEDGGRYWDAEPDAECFEALEMGLDGWDESSGALYFCRTGCSPWMEDNTEYLFTAGNHSFYK